MMQAVHKKRITILPLLVFVGLMMLVTFFLAADSFYTSSGLTGASGAYRTIGISRISFDS